MTATVHRTSWDTYHPDATGAWTFKDTSDADENNPSCTRCGLCDCESFDPEKGACVDQRDETCVGLSMAFLSDSESLCIGCAEKVGIQVIPCDCE